MTKHTAWLHSQIHLWVSEGLIEKETGNTLLQRYPGKNSNSRSISLLTVIGAVVFGLGVILFFAFNWSEFSKTAQASTDNRCTTADSRNRTGITSHVSQPNSTG